MVFTRKVHAEIFQFNIFSNNKMKTSVLSTSKAQFCRPRALFLLVASQRKLLLVVVITCNKRKCRYKKQNNRFD